ncbi:MAG: 5,10-methylenetetrahydromethanopterin reductase [Solirubrobacteraceae bacterium]|jgi:5,10-methylenetetrahydromethanopterin reductase|nr:5,10-methylenetetrahydromethanopterin reductase [Solirubrobacteraceae bacterium]
MDISCAFATSPDTPDHVALAEELGYRRAWLYDSPALYPDLWATMALAASRTARIGLGTGVLVPRLRHVIVTAAAAAQIEQLAPGRLVIGVGTGFTGSRALGQKAMKWADVASYVEALRGLLLGETVEWEGAALRLMHPHGYSAPLPLEVPIVIAAEGPKGIDVARRLGDGMFVTLLPPQGIDWTIRLSWGTVLEEGEDAGSERVVAAAGPAVSVLYHAAYELRGAEGVAGLPGGPEWAQAAEAISESERHLAIHAHHLESLNDLDRGRVSPDLIPQTTLTGTAEQVRAKVEEIAATGITEIAYQPIGPDIPRELRAFSEATHNI